MNTNPVTINAIASDADGTITKVEFFQGATKLGESITSPYNFVWNNIQPGSYSLTARATDNSNTVNTSAPVNIVMPVGWISGRVTRTDGTTAIAGANVKVYQGVTLMGIASANATGDYTVGVLSTGTSTVEASAIGYETNTQTGIAVNAGTNTLNISLAVPIHYLYDALGRLVSVIDKDGNAATYSYDAVGNLLSISRQAPAQASIIQFNPGSGPVGTTVTIYGTGFSATASQNTVTFNGVGASVISSSTTLIVVNVPSGASTGPINVTSPVGSATSSASFTVGSGASGAPTISSFTPTVGTAGTAVTITGTNYDATIGYDRVSFNLMHSLVGSATSTSIATTVPANATSGKISVATPLGKAVSNADFFAPPSPYTAASVGFTGRMSIGGNITATISTANKIGLVLFDGVAGQKVSFNISPVTISSSYEYIYTPNGTLLLSTGFVSTSGKFIDTFTLPMTGTYTILVDPQQYTGSITMTLYNIVDVSGTISPGGAAVPVIFSFPGQNASLTFSANQNQRVSLSVSGVTTAGSGAHSITVYKPDGTSLASITDITNGSFIDAQTLPVSGTYRIFANPASSATGSWTLTLYDVASDITGPITPGGAAVGIALTSPGQNARLTFSGTSGQRISLNLTAVTISTSYVSIVKPDSTNLVSPTFVSTGSKFIDTQLLPVTGTYTILVDPQGTYTGNMTLRLYNVPADGNSAITPGGSPVTVAITVPGQNAGLSFSGTSGQRVSLNIGNVTINGTRVYINKPDGSTLLWDPNVTMTGAYFDAVTLPVTGTYSIFVDPQIEYTGSMTLTLFDCTDFVGSTTVGGASVTVPLNTPGKNGQVTFSGTSGQVVTVHVTGNTIAGVSVRLFKPDGTQQTWASSSNSSFNLPQQTLSATGTYTITIDPPVANTGTLTVSVTSP